MALKTTRVAVNDPDALRQAMYTLRTGGLVAFPTDTVYGLAADVHSEAAIERIFEVKDRDMSKAIAVLVGEVSQLALVAENLSETAHILAARFWPGALTLVVPKHSGLPDHLSPYTTVGVRMPDHAFARELLRAAGPLATTSANRSGGPNPLTADDVLEQLDGRLDLLIDGGRCPGGVPSTVVDCTGAEARILRQGAITAAEIEHALGRADSSSV
ncbi:MAG TPA: threonylcarbamoyl-AMP synthase [Chloroflexi bacterium]|jgi:L-threonylcarbamoyladenylate synthase|nr:threonylcarbamoyl-AMP synthase [Chloroflexota bacterium]